MYVVMIQEHMIWHKHIPKLDEIPESLGNLVVEPGSGQVCALMYLHELKQWKTIEDLEIESSS